MSWLDEVKEEIANSSETSSIYIGSDSVKYTKRDKKMARYSVVVIVHKDSRHGCRLFHLTETKPDYGNMKQRLLNEVGYTISVATDLIEVIGERHLEIHIDVNSQKKYASHAAVKEALGWVKGSLGIDAKIKPNAWAASTAADHAVRNLN